MSFSNVKLMNSLCFEAELLYRLHIAMIVAFLNLFACLIHLVIYQKVAYQILKYILGLFKTVKVLTGQVSNLYLTNDYSQ